MMRMGIEDIRKRILEDAAQEREEILAEARKKAEEIRKEGERTAEKRKEAIISKALEEAREEHNRAVTMERLESRKVLLAEKQKIVEKAFERSLDVLVNHPEYEQILETMLLGVAKGGEELILSPRDLKNLGNRFLKKVNNKLNGKLTLSDESREIAGGFILQTPEVEINESFEERIRVLRDEIEADVARMLFEG